MSFFYKKTVKNLNKLCRTCKKPIISNIKGDLQIVSAVIREFRQPY